MAVVAFAVSGCQAYDFEPVSPLAVAQDARSVPLAFGRPKPNLMLLVDKSGSMGDPVTSGGSKKIDVLKAVMGDFLTSSATVARVGLAKFPNSSCTGTTVSDVLASVPPGTAGDADSVLLAAAQAANGALQGLSPGGGTPTAASLQFLLDNAGELTDAKRDNFVLLLTDGLPNCNSALDANTCTCTSSTQRPCQTGSTDCLDKDGTVARILALKSQRNIRTVVIGFGADVVGGVAQDTLEAMAEAGAFVRKCPNANQSCGTGNPCVLATGLCSKQYFQATDGAALVASLAEIGKTLTQETCRYTLVDVPTDPLLLSVVVNGTAYPRGTDNWSYDPSKNQIVFLGALCDRIKGNTSDNPVRLDIRLLKVL